MTSETDQEQRKRIAEMEKDMTGIEELQCTLPLYLIGGV
jgi:hypothetical protein